MGDQVKIVECPRDAWQGLPGHIPAEAKAAYLRKLIEAGFKHIDAVSFVSPAAVPQMADSEEVLALLDPSPETEIVGIVVNAKGAGRAIATGKVHTVGFPYSISPQFLMRNQNQSPEESLRILASVAARAAEAGLRVVAYISMAFGNPYGDLWSIGELKAACDALVSLGIREISLADTVGVAGPERIGEVVARLLPEFREIEIGVHLHARPDQAPAKIRAAYGAGCRLFDAAMGGLGGCPFAQDALVGNIATELLVAELGSLGAGLPALRALDELSRQSAELAHTFSAAQQ